MFVTTIQQTTNARTNQEDAFGYNQHLWAVADGLGGHAHGELASQEAIDMILEVPHTSDSGVALNLLTTAIIKINDKLNSYHDSRATTLTVIYHLKEDKFLIVHVGDSAAYELYVPLNSKPQVRKLTTQHGSGHMLWLCLGSHTLSNELLDSIETKTFTLKEDRALLLATDGLESRISIQENLERSLERYLKSKDEHTSLLLDMQETSISTGSTDNITMICIEAQNE